MWPTPSHTIRVGLQDVGFGYLLTPWAAWYVTGLLIKVTPKGVFFFYLAPYLLTRLCLTVSNNLSTCLQLNMLVYVYMNMHPLYIGHADLGIGICYHSNSTWCDMNAFGKLLCRLHSLLRHYTVMYPKPLHAG